MQDVRGRFESEGEWYPFKYEANDGYDTIEWAGSLPYTNGKVGMFGGSYVGATQMLAAMTKPPHLAAICPTVTASNYHENWTYQGGAFRTVVQPIVDFGIGGEHGSAPVEQFENGHGWNEYATADGVRAAEGGCGKTGSVLSGLAGASEF